MNHSRNTEVHDFYGALAVEHYVGRLQIAVHNSLRMGLAQPRANLARDVQSLGHLQRSRAIQLGR